jgi:hypothetical protein
VKAFHNRWCDRSSSSSKFQRIAGIEDKDENDDEDEQGGDDPVGLVI